VVRNVLTDTVRHRKCYKERPIYVAESLDAPISREGQGLTLMDQVDSQGADGRPQDGYSQILLKASIEKVLPSLSPRRRRLCVLLGEGWPMTEITAYFGIDDRSFRTLLTTGRSVATLVYPL
jgi:DNA-directed RNA polymerase specialized sigma24 family protein